MESRGVFGESLTPADSVEPAGWLREAVDISSWTVGGLLPPYESYLLVESAPAGIEDWWAAQRQIVVAMAEVLIAYTHTPDEAWFAIWEGSSSRWSSVEALQSVPRFELPWRAYFLMAGRVLDVQNIVDPLAPHGWFRPDLWWPSDRRWFVGTDVDFWCNYVGGSREATDDIASRLPGLCRPAELDEPLRIED